jgi:uncharacterized Ntn-hydrolase superfamily protein
MEVVMRVLPLLLLFLAGLPSAASATWSILAVDRKTGEVVIASATCVAGAALNRMHPLGLRGVQAIVAPGKGGAVAQASVDTSWQNQTFIHGELLKGTAPSEIIAALEQRDPRMASRQFGIVDVQGRSAGYSGSGNGEFSLDEQGEVEGTPIVFSVQGNILAGVSVVHEAVKALRGASGALTDRVMAAMEAADRNGGDRRCSCDRGPKIEAPCDAKTAHVAYILKADPTDKPGAAYNDGQYALYISVTDQDIKPSENANPVKTLRLRYDAWKAQAAVGPRWFKGNTHAHTLESDGDSTPDEVTRWYREHGYHFLVLSDHNTLTPVDDLNAKYAEPGAFTLIRGEEVTSAFEGKAIHVNGIDTKERIGRQAGNSVIEVLQRSIDAVRAQEGVPHINHPNFTWALTADQLKSVKNNKLFEIYNGHPMVNNFGGGGIDGTEAAWDAILSSGVLLYGIAVDDAHHFKDLGNPKLAGPGRGWIVVRAAELTPRAILAAMERGDFYASTGVELSDYEVSDTAMTVTVKKDSFAKYRIQFIGQGGRVLHEALDSPASYEFRGDEGYVRARVLESNGRIAWGQPVVVKRE